MRTLLAHVSGLAVLLVTLSSCGGTQATAEIDPDDQFGHRYDDGGPDGRATLGLIEPNDATKYFYYPAVVEDLHIRPASFDPSQPADAQEVAVEVLIKGGLADGCTQLHDVTQERIAQLITVTLRTRKPQGAICTTVFRPYRFYLDLEGTFAEGAYTLKVNDQSKSFSVRMQTPSSN